MADITMAELVAAMPDGDLKDWWTAAAVLPAGIEPNEFFLNTLKSAHDAARTKNAGLSAGARIDGYPAPTYAATVLNTTTGEETQVVTSSVRSRVPLNRSLAISPLI